MNWLFDCLIDWLINLLMNWLFDCLMDWLIDWFNILDLLLLPLRVESNSSFPLLFSPFHRPNLCKNARLNSAFVSLRKQPTVRGATTGFTKRLWLFIFWVHPFAYSHILIAFLLQLLSMSIPGGAVISQVRQTHILLNISGSYIWCLDSSRPWGS